MMAGAFVLCNMDKVCAWGGVRPRPHRHVTLVPWPTLRVAPDTSLMRAHRSSYPSALVLFPCPHRLTPPLIC
jgi:hypothetical protein